MPLVRATETGREQTEETQKWSFDVGFGPLSRLNNLFEVFWKTTRYRVIVP